MRRCRCASSSCGAHATMTTARTVMSRYIPVHKLVHKLEFPHQFYWQSPASSPTSVQAHVLACLLSQVNPKAGICPDFQKGYCPQGDACKLKHILDPTASTPGSGKRPTEGGPEGEGGKRRRVVLRKGAVAGGGAGVTLRGEGGADASLWGAGRRNGSGAVSSTDRCERTEEDKEEEARIEAQVRQLLSEYAGQAGTSLVSVSYDSPAFGKRSFPMYRTLGHLPAVRRPANVLSFLLLPYM